MVVAMFLWTCAASGLAAAILARMAWRRRYAAPAATPLAVFFVSVSIWDFAYASYSGIARSQLTMAIMYVGVAMASPSAFVFVARLGRFEWLVNRLTLAVLAAISLFIAGAAATDARFGLLFHGHIGSDRLLREHAGAAFWVNVVYAYSLLAAVTLMVMIYLHRSRQILYRRQFAALLIGVIVPWMSSLGFVFNLTDRDITPAAFGITVVLIGTSMWRYRGLSVVPVARYLLVERMSDGVIVIDDKNMLSDLNPAAVTMFHTGKDAVGTKLENAPVLASALAGLDRTAKSARFEFVIPDPSTPRSVEITSHAMEDKRGRQLGLLIVVRDITHRVGLEHELEQLASTDALTGIGNRRRFDERLALEHARALRTGLPLTLVIVDVDRLKQINDRGGHRAGDLALQRVAHHVEANARRVDLAARIGGDEFALLLPETSDEDARPVVERILEAVAADRDPRLVDTVTVSVGVATIDATQHTVEDLQRFADDAMYQAKDAGRNRIHMATAP